MTEPRRTCSLSYALAALGCNATQLDQHIRRGRLTRPRVGLEDLDLAEVDQLAAELAKEQP